MYRMSAWYCFSLCVHSYVSQAGEDGVYLLRDGNGPDNDVRLRVHRVYSLIVCYTSHMYMCVKAN